MEKKCFKCREVKPLLMFYEHKDISDGSINKCKDCCKADAKQSYSKNRDKYAKYEKERANLPHRIQARKDYQKTEQGKAAIKRSHQKFIKKYPEKRQAHILVDNYIRNKKLIRPNHCENCYCECTPHAHHNDYTKPLEVTWLCVKCHVEWHKHNKPIYKPKAA